MSPAALSATANTKNNIKTHTPLCAHYSDYCGEKNTQSQQLEAMGSWARSESRFYQLSVPSEHTVCMLLLNLQKFLMLYT